MALLLEDGSYLLLELNTEPAGKLLLRGDPGAIFHSLAPDWRTANFGTGTTEVAWTSPLDPSERKIYTVDTATELRAVGDTIQSVTVTLSGTAVLAGLEIYGVTNDDTNVSIWLQVGVADRGRSGWTAPGEVHVITVQVTGQSGHVFERDIDLRVSQL